MIHLALRHDCDYARMYIQDVTRIVRVMSDRGYFLLSDDAAEAWHRHSERVSCDRWTSLPDDDRAIVDAIIYETYSICPKERSNRSDHELCSESLH